MGKKVNTSSKVTINEFQKNLLLALKNTKECTITDDNNIAKTHGQGVIKEIKQGRKCVVTVNGIDYNMVYASYLTLNVGDMVLINYYNEDKNRGYVQDLYVEW